jgi:hypothetical protein
MVRIQIQESNVIQSSSYTMSTFLEGNLTTKQNKGDAKSDDVFVQS